MRAWELYIGAVTRRTLSRLINCLAIEKWGREEVEGEGEEVEGEGASFTMTLKRNCAKRKKK